MSGGTWELQNKIIPGAYINFKSFPGPTSEYGARGVATLPIAMSWGAEKTVIEVLSTDLLDGASEVKIGYTSTDPESLIFRECLSHCSKLYVYRMDTGGVKATFTIDGGAENDLVITAKYPGVVGNQIAVIVSSNEDGTYEVSTLYRTKLKDVQTITVLEDLVANEWVTFAGTGTPVVNVGTYLAGGTDGTIVESNYNDYLAAIQGYNWNTMGLPTKSNTNLVGTFSSFIKELRDGQGIKRQVVLYNYVAGDHEGLISIKQGYKTNAEIITEDIFVATYTGMTAGASYTESNTAKVIEGAIEIINPLTPAEIESNVKLGHVVIGPNSEGKPFIIKDINTFTSFTPIKKYHFSKNKVIRVADSLNYDIKNKWEKSYMGKIQNLPATRSLFKVDIVNLIAKGYVRVGAITEFKPATDVMVKEGDQPDSVVAVLTPKVTDAMEILYMNILLK